MVNKMYGLFHSKNLHLFSKEILTKVCSSVTVSAAASNNAAEKRSECIIRNSYREEIMINQLDFSCVVACDISPPWSDVQMKTV